MRLCFRNKKHYSNLQALHGSPGLMFIIVSVFLVVDVVSELVPFLYVKKLPTAFASISTLGFFPSMFCTFFFASTRFSRETLDNQVILTRERFSSVRYINLLGDYTSSALTSHFNLNQHSKPQQVNSKMRSLLILLCFVVLTIAFVGNDLFDGV